MKMINCTDTRRRWDEHTVLEEKEANVCLESFPGISPTWGFCTERSRPRKNIRLIIRMKTTTTCWSISLYAVEGIKSAEKTVGSIFSCCWKTPTESQYLFESHEWLFIRGFCDTRSQKLPGVFVWYYLGINFHDWDLNIHEGISFLNTSDKNPQFAQTIFTHQKLWVGQQDSQVQKSRNARNCH